MSEIINLSRALIGKMYQPFGDVMYKIIEEVNEALVA